MTDEERLHGEINRMSVGVSITLGIQLSKYALVAIPSPLLLVFSAVAYLMLHRLGTFLKAARRKDRYVASSKLLAMNYVTILKSVSSVILTSALMETIQYVVPLAVGDTESTHTFKIVIIAFALISIALAFSYRFTRHTSQKGERDQQ